MAKKIQHDDLIQRNLLNPTIEQVQRLIVEIEKLEKQFKDILKVSSEFSKNNPLKSYSDVKNAASNIDSTKKAVDGLNQTEKERLRLEEQLKIAVSEEGKQNEILRQKLNQQKKVNRDLAKEKNNLIGAYSKESKRLNDLRNQYKNLIIVQGKETRETRKLRKEINLLDRQLKKVDANVGQFQRNVGNYSGAIGGGLRNIMAGFGLYLGGRSIIDAIGLGANFEKQMSKVKAVTGATGDEFQRLSKLARDLGESTEYTATEVSALELSFAKLGFTVTEIEKITGATLDLATATGSELGRSAEVAGATLRGFGLDASEMQRVVDVMAKSFSSSALDMEKFSTAMATVAPVAKNAGFSIEQTTAMLGSLVDRGVDASTAGTSLRNIFLTIAKEGISYSEAMNRINNATDKNAVALELFGKRGATVATILAETGDQVNVLTDKLYDSNGAALEMADTMRDNLLGDVDKLKSAFQGLILDGTGALNESFRSLIQWLTKNIDVIARTATVVMSMVVAFKAAKLATQAATTAMKLFTAASPIGWMKALIPVAVGVATYLGLISQKSVEASDDLERFNEIAKEGEDKLNDFNAELEIVKSSLDSSKKGTDEYKDAMKKLNGWLRKVGEKELSLTASEKDLAAAMALVNEKITQRIMNEIYYDQLKELIKLEQEYLAIMEKREPIAEKQLKSGNARLSTLDFYKKLSKGLKDTQDQINALDETDTKFSEKKAELTKLMIQQQDGLRKQFAGVDNEYADALEKLQRINPKIDALKRKMGENITVQSTFTTTDTTNYTTSKSKIKKASDDWKALNEEVQKTMAYIDEPGAFFDEFTGTWDIYGQRYADYLLTRKSADESYLDWKHRFDQEIIDSNQDVIDEINADFDELNAVLKSATDTFDKGIDSATDALKKEMENRAKVIEQITEKLTDHFLKQSDKRIEAIDNEKDAAQKREEFLRELAIRGTDDAISSLAFEQKKIAELERERQRELRNQKRLEIAAAAIKTYSAKVANGDKNALSSTIIETETLLKFIQNLPTFWTGTGTGTIADRFGDPTISGRDGYIIRADGSEKIFTGDQSAKIGQTDPNVVADLAYMYRTGNLFKEKSTTNPSVNIGEKLDKLIQLESKKPVLLDRYYNETERAIIDTYKKGNRIEKTHKKLRLS